MKSRKTKTDDINKVEGSLGETEEAAVLLKEKKKEKKPKKEKKEKKSGKKVGLKTTLHAKKLLIIEIGKYDTFISEVSITGNTDNISTTKIKLFKALTMQNPDGTWEDDKLSNIQALATELNKTLSENKIKTKQVMWVANSESILTRDYDKFPLQGNDKTNLEIINNKADELFPISMDDYVLDYKVLEEYSNAKSKVSLNADLKEIMGSVKNEKTANVQIYAAPKKLIDSYYRLAKACQLITLSIDYSGQSMVNISEYLGGNALLIDINYDSTLIYTIINGKLTSLPRRVTVGYDTIISNAFKRPDIFSEDINKAYEIIQEKNLLFNKEYEEQDKNSQSGYGESLHNIMADILYDFETIIEQIGTSIEGANRKNGGNIIKDVYIVSKLKYFPDLTEDIEQIYNTKVHYLNEFTQLNTKLEDIDVPNFLHIFGSALGNINLKIDTEAEVKSKNATTRMIILLSVLTIAGLAGATYYTNTKLETLKARQSELDERLTEAQLAEVIANRAKLSDYTKSQLKTLSVDWLPSTNQIMTDLEELTPSKAYYNSVVLNEKDLVIDVVLENRNECIKILNELEKLEYFKNIDTPGITKITDPASGLIVYNMAITCEFITEEDIDTNEQNSESEIENNESNVDSNVEEIVYEETEEIETEALETEVEATEENTETDAEAESSTEQESSAEAESSNSETSNNADDTDAEVNESEDADLMDA